MNALEQLEQHLNTVEARHERMETVNVERTAAFKAEVEALCRLYGFHLVHFTPIGRPERMGYLPWISAHFEQLPIEEDN